SVWWSWTAPAAGATTIDTIGSAFDTTRSEYSGAGVAGLTTVASDDDGGGNQTSRVAFTAVAGTTYRIAVDGFGGATGSITLHLAGPAGSSGPANDNFASAITISGSTSTQTGTNVGATKETGEPSHAGNAGGHSVWWSWTAPGSGQATIDTIGSAFDTT